MSHSVSTAGHYHRPSCSPPYHASSKYAPRPGPFTDINNFTKQLRQHYQAPEPPPFSLENVSCRNSCQLIHQRGEGKWKSNFIRRKINLERGYFSSSNQQYSALGGHVVLDAKELVFNVFKDSFDDKFNQYQARYRKDEFTEKSSYPLDDTCISKGDDVWGDSTDSDGVQQGQKISVGSLSQHIRESYNHGRAVLGGQCYRDVVLADQLQRAKEQGNVKPVESMVVIPIDSLLQMVLAPSSPQPSSPTPGAAGSGIAPQPPAGDFAIDPLSEKSSSTNISIQSPSMQKADMDTDMLMQLYRKHRKDRLKRDHLKKLEAILGTLYCLTNMRTKDLRSKLPLSTDALKNLRKDYTESKAGQGRNSRQTNRVSADTLLQDNPAAGFERFSYARNSIMITSGTPHRPSLLTSAGAGLRDVFTGGLNSDRCHFLPQAIVCDVITLAAPQAPQPANSERVETWEDLLQIPDHREQHLRRISKVVLDMTPYSTRTQRKPPESHDDRKLPIWQQIAFEKSDVTSGLSNKKRVDADMRLRNIQTDFRSLKVSLNRMMKMDLESNEKNKLVTFANKYKVMEYLPPLYEQQKQRMWRVLKTFMHNSDNIEIQPALWYDKLMQETNSIIMPPDSDAITAMNKLARFSQVEAKTIPNAKAKLCLFLMSMPAFELCDFRMQRALKFVLEEILLCTGNQFEHWMECRRLPMVLIDSSK